MLDILQGGCRVLFSWRDHALRKFLFPQLVPAIDRDLIVVGVVEKYMSVVRGVLLLGTGCKTVAYYRRPGMDSCSADIQISV